MEKTHKVIEERINFLQKQLDVSIEGLNKYPDNADVYNETIKKFSDALNDWNALKKGLEENIDSDSLSVLVHKTIAPLWTYNYNYDNEIGAIKIPVGNSFNVKAYDADGQKYWDEKAQEEIQLLSDVKDSAIELKEKFGISIVYPDPKDVLTFIDVPK